MLGTGVGSPPLQYTLLVLCRDIYHCTPSQLYREDWGTILDHIALLNVETEARMLR